MKDLLLALPRLGRMLISLAADRDVPTAAKVVLAALAVYLVSPIDLIPDFIPFLGYLDDVILAAVVVDGVLNFIDRPLLLRYWPGTPESLERVAAVARRLARWVPTASRRASSEQQPSSLLTGEGRGGASMNPLYHDAIERRLAVPLHEGPDRSPRSPRRSAATCTRATPCTWARPTADPIPSSASWRASGGGRAPPSRSPWSAWARPGPR